MHKTLPHPKQQKQPQDTYILDLTQSNWFNLHWLRDLILLLGFQKFPKKNPNIQHPQNLR